MEVSVNFKCFIIGEGTLPIQCADLLSRKGHIICGIVSSDVLVRKWAKEKGIVTLEPSGDLTAFFGATPFDYLFSIVNEHILTDETLLAALKLAINYHDAPLPKYAGTHATSWALLNGESSHGVTWHVISKKVDAGDILKQRIVTISPHETAFSLNTKCYEAAIHSFAELVDELSTGRAVITEQDLSQRTFFPRFKRFSSGAVLSWNRSAADISATVRALDLGPHPNPLGAPKVFVGNEYILVRSIDICGSRSTYEPGTVVEVASDFLRIATATNDVMLRNIAFLDGQPLTVNDLATKYGLVEGTRLTETDEETSLAIEKLNVSCSKHEAFWARKLAALQPLALPYTTSHPTQNSPSQCVEMDVPKAVFSLFDFHVPTGERGDFVLAVWSAYLSRIGNVESFDLSFLDQTSQDEFRSLENLFASHVPLRINVTSSQNLLEFYTATRQTLDEVRQHKTYIRDIAARYPALRSIGAGKKQLLPVAVEVIDCLAAYATEDSAELTLRIARDGSACSWVFDPAIFEAVDVERMVSQFRIFLNGLLAAPASPIARLPLMSREELHQMLVEWNDTTSDVPSQRSIHQLFESQAERTPEAVAVVYNQERLTYRELNKRANQLARHLQKLGVGPETLVGICLDRSVELVVGLIGILKAGGAYVPLDSSYPQERLTFIVEDTCAPVIVTQKGLLNRLPRHSSQVVCVDTDLITIERESDENFTNRVNAENLAYLIYTSGSTGRPKGVAIEHRSTVALIQWAQTVFSPEQLRGVLASTSVCFDLSVFELFVPLSCGGCVILADNALQLATLNAASEVTLVNSVPSAMAELIRMQAIPPSVQIVNLAGEPLQTSLVQQIYQQTNTQKVYDLYGPSEDTTYSTFALRHPTERATIGRPIANTQVYLLDKNMEPVPIGIPGELYLGGAGLARGYLNRPELTEERFVANPFNVDSNARLYRTGDVARYFPNGNIEYLGRLDHQVKLRGFRIELGEIEAVLNQHSAVRDTIVVAHKDSLGTMNLVAYVVPNVGSVPTILELREFLKEKLPHFMVPSFFVMLEHLPLTPNGKVDRGALPEPELSGCDLLGNFVAPRDELEQGLVKIWEDVLKIQPVGVTENFFEVGGHSLLAVRMFAQIEKQYGKQFPLATLFQAPTIEHLATLMHEERQGGNLTSLVTIQPNGSKPPFFCIHARGGNILFYRDLSKRLGSDQPFYGLQAQGMDGKHPRHTAVEEMAAHYIKELKTVQPTGPYFLGGASFGGTAAFEMAQQLRADGEEVALLALFDTTGPGYPKLLPTTTGLRSKIYDFARRIEYQVNCLKLLEKDERGKYVKQKLNKIRVRTIRGLNKSSRAIAAKLPNKVSRLLFPHATDSPWALLEQENAIRQAIKNYIPQPYAGRLTLFRATRQPHGIYPDATLGWRDLVTGELEIHEVPGFHGTIVAEPHVRFLAEKLRTCLTNANSKTAGERKHAIPDMPNVGAVVSESTLMHAGT